MPVSAEVSARSVSGPMSPAAPCPVACGAISQPRSAASRTAAATWAPLAGATTAAGFCAPLELSGEVARW